MKPEDLELWEDGGDIFFKVPRLVHAQGEKPILEFKNPHPCRRIYGKNAVNWHHATWIDWINGYPLDDEVPF